MGGYGTGIVIGTTWGVSSLVCWGAGAWRTLWGKKGDGDDVEGESDELKIIEVD